MAKKIVSFRLTINRHPIQCHVEITARRSSSLGHVSKSMNVCFPPMLLLRVIPRKAQKNRSKSPTKTPSKLLTASVFSWPMKPHASRLPFLAVFKKFNFGVEVLGYAERFSNLKNWLVSLASHFWLSYAAGQLLFSCYLPFLCLDLFLLSVSGPCVFYHVRSPHKQALRLPVLRGYAALLTNDALYRRENPRAAVGAMAAMGLQKNVAGLGSSPRAKWDQQDNRL